ncbi:YpdA family putative bacillithiol disulfide reductase [Salisediminibacterium halotolerans]|uniref:YpdA family putative bacillithiol disulfide reductase n=1 Tax=Salisediminibacterium halotolerans TaxID=517425 RepID=UPI00116B89DD|nr:YpdA family putative bacillithiol disulfide reductase [Salisediminibacterium halotolerans]GEL08096.1 hypothetical protein SHA02_15120 [Salisediminibacterium halotolerans]
MILYRLIEVTFVNQEEEIIVIGGGPCGLSAAIELQNKGFSPLIIEQGNIVHSLFHYPTHQQFFSTSDKLAIGGIPFFSTERKPKRNEALVYYREVVHQKQLRIRSYEKVTQAYKQQDGSFQLQTKEKTGNIRHYRAKALVIAIGYYNSPNRMNVPGEEYPHVYHYFHEAHPFFDQKVAVIGGKNSAVDAALELEKAGAEVTVYYRGNDYSESIKPWILPEFTSLIKNGKISMYFNTEVTEIHQDAIDIVVNGEDREKHKADFVFAMTGYHPDHSFIRSIGVSVDETTGRPMFDPETMETNIHGVYIAGVIAAGNNANEIFIENGRHHGSYIAENLAEKWS